MLLTTTVSLDGTLVLVPLMVVTNGFARSRSLVTPGQIMLTTNTVLGNSDITRVVTRIKQSSPYGLNFTQSNTLSSRLIELIRAAIGGQTPGVSFQFLLSLLEEREEAELTQRISMKVL